MAIGGYIRMNGSVGCLPDSVEVYESSANALDAAGDLFDDLPESEWNLMRENLARYGVHHFTSSAEAGADYVSIEYDPEVEHDGNGGDYSCNQCQAAVINGLYCHETGCPNARKVKIDGEWVDG